MRGFALASVVALTAFSGTAFADIAFVNTYTNVTVANGALSWAAVGGPTSGSLNAVDATTGGLQLNSNGLYVITMTVKFDLLTKPIPSDYPSVVLHGIVFDTGYTASLTGLTWSTDGAGPVTTSAALNTALASGSTIKVDGGLFTGLIGTSVNQLDIQFTVNSNGIVGQYFLLDAVSNPEPGTMALFGLGALGLGGAAWRRRKAKKANAAKA